MAELKRVAISLIVPSPKQIQVGEPRGLPSMGPNGPDDPLHVRPKTDGRFELVDGHERLFECKKRGLESVWVLSQQRSDAEVVLFQLDKNLDRKVHSAYELGLKFRQVLDTHPEMSQESLGQRYGHNRGWTNKHLALLSLENCIPGDTLNRLTEKQGRAILTAPEDFRATIGDAIESYLETEEEMPTAEQIIDMIAVEMQRREDEERKQKRHKTMAERIEEELGPKPHTCEANEGETTCRVCGRLLSAPESVKNGIGPVCASGAKKQAEEPVEFEVDRCATCRHQTEPEICELDEGECRYEPLEENVEATDHAVDLKIPYKLTEVAPTKQSLPATPRESIEQILGQYPDAKDSFIISILTHRHSVKESEARAHVNAYRRKEAPPTPTPTQEIIIYVVSPTGKVAATYPLSIPIPDGYHATTEKPTQPSTPSPQAEEPHPEALN